MTTSRTALSPIHQAEQARQVVGVLSRMETRFANGSWRRGAHTHPGGGNCLIGAIDEAGTWAMPGVMDEVTAQLAARLPRMLRPLAGLRPRLALALYNDTVGFDGAVELVRRTREELGGLPRTTADQPAQRTADPAEPRTIWVADTEPVA